MTHAHCHTQPAKHLTKENLTRPKGVVRVQAVQDAVNQQCKSLALYQFKTCPFCIRVRQEMSHLSLDIERIDAQHVGMGRQALLKGGGQAKVPCLTVTDKAGKTEWLYDSEKITAYLRGRFVGA